MKTMADAAPGERPQTAVVPGKMCHRLIVQPMRLLATITEDTMPRKSGQRPRKLTRMSGVRARAIMQPITAWHAYSSARGTRISPP